MIELRQIINSIPEHWIKEDKERTFFKYFELQIADKRNMVYNMGSFHAVQIFI